MDLVTLMCFFVQWHDGKEWDLLLDVDADGTDLKLAMNRGEDPYTVADRFMMEHNLPATYLEQIVQFIIRNTGDSGGLLQPQLPSRDSNPLCNNALPAKLDLPWCSTLLFSYCAMKHDRWIIQSFVHSVFHSVAGVGGSAAGGGDPLTGHLAYRPPGSSNSNQPSTTARGPAAAAGLVYTPHREYQYFEAAPAADKVAGKVREFNSSVPADMQLSQEEAGTLDELLEVCHTWRRQCHARSTYA